MTDFLNSTLAVSGAGGELGRLVVKRLQALGAKHIVALTRDPARLADFAAAGVDVRTADFDDAASLPKAFAGVDRLLLISTNATDGAGLRLSQHRRAIDAAEAAGVKHIVYTSVTSPYPDETNFIANDHFWTEQRLAASKLDWTSLRNNQYIEYLLPGAQQAIASGTLFHASGTGHAAYVTRADCALAAAGALVSATGKHVCDISGPEAISADELAAIFAEVSGKPVRAQNVPGAGLKAGLTQHGVPEQLAQILVRFQTDGALGYFGIVTDAVQQLGGQPATSVRDWLKANLQSAAA